jgi:hypothetical protein
MMVYTIGATLLGFGVLGPFLGYSSPTNLRPIWE